MGFRHLPRERSGGIGRIWEVDATIDSITINWGGLPTSLTPYFVNPVTGPSGNWRICRKPAGAITWDEFGTCDFWSDTFGGIYDPDPRPYTLTGLDRNTEYKIKVYLGTYRDNRRLPARTEWPATASAPDAGSLELFA